MEITSALSDSINANDTRFVAFLNEFIEQELATLDENGFSFQNKEKFLIFREAFVRVSYLCFKKEKNTKSYF
jgi:hypothetical protein